MCRILVWPNGHWLDADTPEAEAKAKEWPFHATVTVREGHDPANEAYFHVKGEQAYWRSL